MDPELIPAKADLGSYFLTTGVRFNQMFLSLDFWWDPTGLIGASAWSNPQFGFCYPPSWLSAWIPPSEAIRLGLLLHWGVFLGGICLLGRRMDIRWAFLVPFAVLLSMRGTFLSVATMIQNFQTMAWFPWIVALAWREESRRREQTALLIVSYFFFAAGEPQASLLIGTVLLVGLALGKRWREALIFLVGCATQPWLLPFLFEAMSGDRAYGLQSLGEAPWWLSSDLALSMWNPWSILRPDMWGWWREQATWLRPNWIQNLYAGFSLVPLALLGLMKTRSSVRWPLVGLGGVFCVLALGDTQLPWLSILRQVPIISMIRFPVRYLQGLDAILIVAGLWGLRALQKGSEPPVWLLSGWGFLGTLVLLLSGDGAELDEFIRIAMAISLTLGGALAWWGLSRLPRKADIFWLPLLLGADASVVAWANHPHWGMTDRAAFEYGDLVRQIPNSEGRWFVFMREYGKNSDRSADSTNHVRWPDSLIVLRSAERLDFSPGAFAANGMQVISEPLVLRPPRSTYLQSMAATMEGEVLRKLLWLVGANHVLAEVRKDGRQTHHFPAIPRLAIMADRVYSVRDVEGAQRIYQPEKIRSTMTWNEVLKDTATNIAYLAPGDCPDSVAVGGIRILDSTSGSHLSVDVRGVRGVVAFRQERRNGWKAMLDGVEIPLITPNLFHSGVCLEGNGNHLEVTYVPPGLAWQLPLSILALLVGVLLVRFRRE